MIKSLFLLFSHRLTKKQSLQVKPELGVDRIVYLPKDLQKLWSAVPPEGQLEPMYLNPIIKWLSGEAQAGDFVLVQGEFGSTFYLVEFCFHKGFVPIYATTQRTVQENPGTDGAVNRHIVFRHVGFRLYVPYRI